MKETSSFKYRQLLSCKCLRMRKASRFVTQFYDQKLKLVGLRITQFSILSLIATDSKRTMMSIAEELLMDRTTLTRGLSILLKNGYIEQLKTKDSRKKIMKLTDKGRRILDKAIPLWLEAEHQILDESKRLGFSVI
ncbi:MAG: MarR family winged helix-turn-helix transcriptional regulator [Alphaproteobacteria bacterium]